MLAEFFAIEGDVKDFPVLAEGTKAKVSRVDAQVDYDSVVASFAGTDLATNFYVRWTGVLKVPKDGKYTFFIESDDGSRLLIDDKPVVDNGGLHPMEEKSGEVELKAGDHPIRIELFQAAGGVGCKVSWQTDGMEKAIIPNAAFAPK